MYSAFGLLLEANRPIPALLPQVSPSPPDIHIWIHDAVAFGDLYEGIEEPYYISDADAGVPALQVWKAASGRYFRLRYADDTQFLVARTGREIRAIVPDASTLEDVAAYLLGPILGFAMRLRGVTCLHASVIAVGDHALAMAGPAGAGKSTAAACFAELGFPVLADDIAALVEHDGALHVQPAYPQLRLWPDSVAMLYGVPDALPRLTPNWDKRALMLSQPGAFHPRSLPLRAVYVLGKPSDQSGMAIEDVSGAERLFVLLANTYVGYLLDPPMRHREFEGLVRLAATVPVRRVKRSGLSNGASAVCTQLLEDCERRECTASPATER